jgi:hypothetical protein
LAAGRELTRLTKGERVVTTYRRTPAPAPLVADCWTSATTDPAIIKGWADDHPGCGFAVSLGKPDHGETRRWASALLVEAGEGEASIAKLRPADKRRIRAAPRMPTRTGWARLFVGRSSARFVDRIAKGSRGLRALGVTDRAWIEITGGIDAS